ncbi:glycosyltransferase family 2 protein [Bacillus arachidis]|uniref:Glycosyltransferase family 2 protein n=1 Tax=Bacillus arachidis TaxID=2819290 RepID=A0ABS3NYK6_9BACI|nr:glycosyltransferase family 2 protein [Bacillus arachidis]MBO1626022.1 glycosyltransferase family 2 protein [Bacillus arachidis]
MSELHVNKQTEKVTSKDALLPKVNVIIAAYNMRDYLKETVDSVLRQDYSNLEIIVADDCSTDSTQEMMKQYEGNPKVKYIRNEVNLGSRMNSQKLLHEHADGKYILGINHDDYLTKDDYIGRAVTFLEENPNVSLVFANLNILHVSSGELYPVTRDIPKITNGIDYFLNYETNRYPHITSVLTSVYRREDAIRMGCFLEKSECQDLFLYLKLMLIGDVGFIADHVGVYRLHENSLSFNMPLESDYGTIEDLEELYSYALERQLNPQKLEQWLTGRIYWFVQWRFETMWLNGQKNSALQLLISISESYPLAFSWIIGRLHWT